MLLNKLLFGFFCLALVIFAIGSASAAIGLTSCTNATSSSGQYELLSTLTSNATCLTLNASNMDLDCKGNSIWFGANGGNGAIGINVLFGVVPLQNITIRNCVIRDINVSGTTGYGIQFTKTSSSFIYNNTVLTNGSSSNHGIYFNTNCNNNLIENNTISAFGTSTGNYGVYLLSASDENIIRRNVITGTGTTTSHAILISTGTSDTEVINNTLSTLSTTTTGNTDGHIVYVTTGSGRNLFVDNIVYGRSAARNYAFYFTASANNNTIVNNTLFANHTEGTNYGVYILYGSSNKVTGNNLVVNGTSLTGVFLSSANNNLVENNSVTLLGVTSVTGAQVTSSYGNRFGNNTFAVNGRTATNTGIGLTSSYTNEFNNNTINVTGTTPIYGFYLLYSESNAITRNNVTVFGTTANSPLFLSTASEENRVTNNSFSVFGNTTLNYGVYLTQNRNNLIESNNITTNGTTTNYGIYLLTAANLNTIKNNIVRTGGLTANYGMFLSASEGNKIIGNLIFANGTTISGTTNNWGIHLAVNSESNLIANNTVQTFGGSTNYGLSLITSSRRNTYENNFVYTSGNNNSNHGLFISEAHRNIFRENVINTSGNGTNFGVYIQSSSMSNIFQNNTISTFEYANRSTSPAFAFLFVAPGYPVNNTLQGNNLFSIAGPDLRFETASLNDTTLVDQAVGNYTFTGIGGILIVRNTTAGEIRFLSPVNGTNTSFSDRVTVRANFVKIDEYTRELNKSAQVTIYNIPTASTELQIVRNGVACPVELCQNLTSLQAGNVTFTVIGGGNYSINSSSSVPSLILNQPLSSFNATYKDLSFNFTASDDVSSILSCTLSLNDSLNQTNQTVSTGVLTNMVIYNMSEGNYSWYVECFDGSNNTNRSQSRILNVSYSIPTVTFNYPQEDAYFNNISAVSINYTVYDSSPANMTVWLYGNGSLLATSYNITNGTLLNYSWSTLGLGIYNWTVISSNGLKNSSTGHRYFNVSNLTISCEAGGSYQEGALVLVQGNLSDGRSGLGLLQANVSVYEDGAYAASRNLTSLSDGSFQTTLGGLAIGNYTLNTSFGYRGYLSYCNDSFTIVSEGGPDASNASLFLTKVASVSSLTYAEIRYNITLSLVNAGGSNATNANITDINSTSSPYMLDTLVAGQSIMRSYVLSFARSNTTSIAMLSGATALAIDAKSDNLLSVFAQSLNVTVPANVSVTPASLVLDKIVTFYNVSNTTIAYNISLRLVNTGGSSSTEANISDADSSSSPYMIGALAAGDSVFRSYLATYTRNSTTYYVNLSRAQSYAFDSYSSVLLRANASDITIPVPTTELGQQLALVKNAYFNSENETAVNYTLAVEVINAGGVDLQGITVIDSDLNINQVIALNQTQTWNSTGSLIIQKEASNSERTFAKSSATVNTVTYQSNQIKISIPGYGGPADTIVYAPAQVNASTSFDSTIEIVNQNPDIGKNFIVDYWITSNDETTNYTSGQQTIYVAASGSTNLTATLTSPSVNGTYRLRALTSYIGGPDFAYDSFLVGSESEGGDEGDSDEGSSGGSGGGGGITGAAVDTVVCTSPYMRYGLECCLDVNNNTLCDRDELPKESETKNDTPIPLPEETSSRSFISSLVAYVGSSFLFIRSVLSVAQNRFAFGIGAGIVAIGGIIFFLRRVIFHSRNSLGSSNRIKNIIGKSVYAENGNGIGVVKEIYLEHYKIYGWIIQVNSRLAKKIGYKRIMVKQKYVKAIGRTMIIDERIAHHLDRYPVPHSHNL